MNGDVLHRPIAYLENNDFNENGDLINPQIPKNIPTVIMFQASWCPHCTAAKPAFQKFANKHEGRVFCATIQADGERESEKALSRRATQFIPGFRGFPEYVLYINGKYVPKQITGRDVRHLEQFAGV